VGNFYLVDNKSEVKIIICSHFYREDGVDVCAI
jgi:hypothetical protein